MSNQGGRMDSPHPRPALPPGLVAGLILIGLGIVFLLGLLFPIGNWVLIILGLGFFVAYLVSRLDGLLWPAGILTGLGLGVLAGSLLGGNGSLEGAAILLGLAAGFVAIYVIDRLYTPPSPVGALWAALGTGVAGFLVLATALGVLGESFWSLMAYAWPIILIVIGGLILFRSRSRRAE